MERPNRPLSDLASRAQASEMPNGAPDAGPGGPGPLGGYIAERFKPEAFFVEADRRAAWWIIDFRTRAANVQFTHVALARAGAPPAPTSHPARQRRQNDLVEGLRGRAARAVSGRSTSRGGSGCGRVPRKPRLAAPTPARLLSHPPWRQICGVWRSCSCSAPSPPPPPLSQALRSPQRFVAGSCGGRIVARCRIEPRARRPVVARSCNSRCWCRRWAARAETWRVKRSRAAPGPLTSAGRRWPLRQSR